MFGWIKHLWYKYVQLPWWLYRFEPRLKKKQPVYEAALQAKMLEVGSQLEERNRAMAEFLQAAGVKPTTYKRLDTWKTESDVDFEARMKVHYDDDDINLDELTGRKKP